MRTSSSSSSSSSIAAGGGVGAAEWREGGLLLKLDGPASLCAEPRAVLDEDDAGAGVLRALIDWRSTIRAAGASAPGFPDRRTGAEPPTDILFWDERRREPLLSASEGRGLLAAAGDSELASLTVTQRMTGLIPAHAA